MNKKQSIILNQIILNSKPLSKKTLLESTIIASQKLFVELENLENILLKKQKQISINQMLLVSVQLEQMKNDVANLSSII